ncbi:hypothetical protein FQN60_010610 [Etheostoma spectabile]|uniref:Uncharacterized protein n=1 Tax=Etheostoma spectabile TaxID=54343 RepID=A0A5J5CC61_9PERO|nr:hypothetical protein FQN60_010610 [Etheostoma spectabile]
MALSLALTATPEGLRVRQYPPSVSVMRVKRQPYPVISKLNPSSMGFSGSK